jgi:hypothetical protein
MNLEEMVAKLARTAYRSGRTDAWRKVKCLNRQEFVIGGWMRADKPGWELRSLLVGYYEKGKLMFAARRGRASAWPPVASATITVCPSATLTMAPDGREDRLLRAETSALSDSPAWCCPCRPPGP